MVDFQCGRDWSTVTFDTLVSLPVRWRDLTRDACLTLNVYCDGFGFHNSNNGSNHRNTFDDVADDDHHDDGTTNQQTTKVWGTSLPLFDEHGRLRSGLYKLKLYWNVLYDVLVII